MVPKKLTIVQLVPEMDIGGVEMVTLEFGSFLAARGHRSIVISKGGRLVDELVKNGSEHIACDHIGEKSPRCLKYIPWLRKFLLTQRVDVLHLRSRLPAWVGYLAWKSLAAARRPLLISTFHGFYSINAYSAIMTKAQKVIAISRVIADHIKTAYPVAEDRIQIIYEGIDEIKFDPDAIDARRVEAVREKWNLGHQLDRPVILLPARITRLKGHDIFIKSLGLIRDLDWVAICVGSADSRSSYPGELETMVINKGLQDRIVFPGNCDDMPAAIKLSDVVVSCSCEPESFGRIAVEAQAMNTPVIATAHGGAVETIAHNHTGILVRPGSATDMAAALGQVIEKKGGYTALSSGRSRVIEMFTQKAMCENTLALYQENLDA